MSYDFLLTIAIIMLFTKVFGLTSERVHMPQVVGALIAGVLVGPSCLGWVGETDFLVKAAEIGVIILMFNAGMDTDLDELKTTGFASFIIALIGVIVPLIGGVACYLVFDNDPTDPMNMLKAAFIGVVSRFEFCKIARRFVAYFPFVKTFAGVFFFKLFVSRFYFSVSRAFAKP